MKVAKVITYQIEATEEEVAALKNLLTVKVQTGVATQTESDLYTFFQANM